VVAAGISDLADSSALASAAATSVVPKHPLPHAQRSHPRKNSRDAWTAWLEDESSSSAADFLESVSSWTEGTAAQLLRPRWPGGTNRPTSTDVEARLRHNLELAARGGEANYVDALAWARLRVLEELRAARDQLPSG
jgi:hypothetical protein